jgi:hypothetical protein
LTAWAKGEGAAGATTGGAATTGGGAGAGFCAGGGSLRGAGSEQAAVAKTQLSSRTTGRGIEGMNNSRRNALPF